MCTHHKHANTNISYYYIIIVRGLVQSHCGKINVIMTLTFYPPPLSVTVVQYLQCIASTVVSAIVCLCTVVTAIECQCTVVDSYQHT